MRRIALVGTAASGIHAPFADPSWEIWGVSNRGAHVTRATRWYELHRLDGEPQGWATEWRRCVKAFSKDIEQFVMLYPEPDLAPNVVQYPTERIVQRYGTFFMTSSFAWMMAHAIDELVPIGSHFPPPDGAEIGIWGVDMEYGTEYREQRAGFRHFVELARFLGIAVTRLATGGLSYEPVPYPMWQDDPLLNKVTLRNREAKAKIKEFDNSLRIARTMIAQNKAVRDSINQSKMEGWDPGQRLRELERELKNLMDTSAKLSEDIVHWQGADDEQSWLLDYLRP